MNGDRSSFQEFAVQKKRQLPDAELVAESLAGDRVSFDALVLRHSPMVLGYLSRRLRNATDAEDVTQDVFLQAFTNLRQLRDPARFGPWVGTIAHHRMVSFHRVASRRQELPGAAKDDSSPDPWARVRDPAPGPDVASERAQTRFAVLEEIGRLRERYREVLFARLVGEESTQEICRRFGLTPDTVRARLLRGMRKLRRALERRGLDRSIMTGEQTGPKP